MSGSHRPPSSRRIPLSRRGKIVAAGTAVAVAGATLGYFAFFPQQAPAFVRSAVRGAMESVGIVEEPPLPPPVCPLTGEERSEGVPGRPALAVKIENAPEARPQASLNDADVVVEEPVEGGYTRFIAVYQCNDSDRVGPVRSARMTDPNYLRQLGRAVFSYSGGVASVMREVGEADLIDVNFREAPEAYTRDSGRAAPHDVFTTTDALWDLGGSRREPEPIFTFSDEWGGKSRRARLAHLPFSSVSDVYWSWAPRDGEWVRAHGEVAHVLEDGSRVTAANVVIQVVEVTNSSIVDAAGNPSPDVELTGSGRAYVLRDGRVIAGRWERSSLEDVTRFVTKDGTEITVAPGRTWVELVPTTIEIELGEPTDEPVEG